MALPTVATPIYELELPSTGKPVKYRPFLVKEEKVLLIALESQDSKQINTAIKQVLKDCIVTKGIKVDTLPTFDIEYLFLNIRGKSVAESVELLITCGDDGTTTVPVTIFIDEIKVNKDPEHTPDIKINDEITVRMKYPSLDEFIQNNFVFENNTQSDVERSFEIAANCIESVYTAEDAWAAADCTKKELISWVETLTSDQFKKIEKFFETMPKLTHKFTVKNPNTGKDNVVILEGLSDFFA